MSSGRLHQPMDATPATPTRHPDNAPGASVLFAALANACILGALWIINSTYAQHRGQTDLDMPDWYVVNVELLMKVGALGIAGAFLLFLSGGLFLFWAGRAGWTMRVGFVMQWLASAAIVGWLFLLLWQ
jgi:hypothetical protein